MIFSADLLKLVQCTWFRDLQDKVCTGDYVEKLVAWFSNRLDKLLYLIHACHLIE